MKIQDLLKSASIENILPIIHDWYYHDDDVFSQEEGYRKAYACLCSIGDMTSVPNGMQIEEDAEIETNPFIINAPDGDFECPWCTQMEFRYWEDSANQEVACADGLRITSEQMAAVCLWHLTFLGFDVEQVRQRVSDIVNADPIQRKGTIQSKITAEELKQHLDEYLDNVEDGEKVYVEYEGELYAIIKVKK